MGGGLELALACDVRFAGRGNWKVGLPEVSLGLIPGEGGTQFAGRVMGPSRALLYMVTGEAFGPEKATELGLFDELVEPDQVEAKALEFAHKCADGPNKAIGFMKLALTEGLELPIYEAFAYERHLQNQLFDTPDSKEGVAAFVEKRQPRWGQKYSSPPNPLSSAEERGRQKSWPRHSAAGRGREGRAQTSVHGPAEAHPPPRRSPAAPRARHRRTHRLRASRCRAPWAAPSAQRRRAPSYPTGRRAAAP